MKVDYERIKNAINTVKMECGELVETGELEHLLFFSPHGSGGQPAQYFFPSSLVNGADIYLWDSIPLQFQKAVLLHEIVEVHYRHTGEYLLPNQKEAHLIARDLENRYAIEIFDSQTLQQYLEFQKEMVAQFAK